MVSEKTVVKNKSGLHARPASEFTRTATRFRSDITLINLENNKKGDAKSIISLLSMLIAKGTEIEIRAEGEDEADAVSTLIQLVQDGFGEL